MTTSIFDIHAAIMAQRSRTIDCVPPPRRKSTEAPNVVAASLLAAGMIAATGKEHTPEEAMEVLRQVLEIMKVCDVSGATRVSAMWIPFVASLSDRSPNRRSFPHARPVQPPKSARSAVLKAPFPHERPTPYWASRGETPYADVTLRGGCYLGGKRGDSGGVVRGQTGPAGLSKGMNLSARKVLLATTVRLNPPSARAAIGD